jgi:DNA gyrase subunit B
MLANNEVKNLIIAMGTGIGETFDISRLRYHRIIIMTDADVDGAHIRTLLLTLFYRHFSELVVAGKIYIAQPPLYKISAGKSSQYAYSDAQRDTIIKAIQDKKAETKKAKSSDQKIAEDKINADVQTAKDLAELAGDVQPEAETGGGGDGENQKISGISIQRYKGLGEMNPEQLWETTMDPTNRVLLKVTVDDAEKADAIFNKLMGEEVSLRKNFIQTHASSVENLDV